MDISSSLEASLFVSGGSALVVGGDSDRLSSFPWETSFSFGAFGGSEVAFVAASFPRETFFHFDTYVGSKVALVVPTLASWVVAETLVVDEAVAGALPAGWAVVGALGAVIAWEAGGVAIRSAGG